MQLTIIIRYIYWKRWLYIRNYRFHRLHIKRHTFQLELNIASEDYMVKIQIESI